MPPKKKKPVPDPASEKIERDKLALERVRKGIVEGTVKSLADIAAMVAPLEESQVPADFVPGLPTEISKAHREALVKLPEVYGKVVLTERRPLTPVEVVALLDERDVITSIAAMAETRKADIKTTVYLGIDAQLDADRAKGEDPPLRDEQGFYVTAHQLGGPERDEEFSREPRRQGATLSSSDLKALVERDDVDFTHQDWLAMTSLPPSGRIFDEAKAMLVLKKRPELIDALAEAAKPGKTTTSLFVRKAKGRHK